MVIEIVDAERRRGCAARHGPQGEAVQRVISVGYALRGRPGLQRSRQRPSTSYWKANLPSAVIPVGYCLKILMIYSSVKQFFFNSS